MTTVAELRATWFAKECDIVADPDYSIVQALLDVAEAAEKHMSNRALAMGMLETEIALDEAINRLHAMGDP